MLGGYAGGQAEFVRVPYADFGPIKVPAHLDDEQVLFLSDILPTGWMAAENCGLTGGDTVAVWGCGPVGQFAIASALLQGAERVIAIDDVPERLAMAAGQGATTIDFAEQDVLDTLHDLTGGRGADACIDAVGLEAHTPGLSGAYHRVKTAMMLETDRPHALHECIMACRSGGTVSVPGVYGGFIDKMPFGAVMNRALTIKTGQTHVQRYLEPLLEKIESGAIDPRFVITHRLSLEEAPDAYAMFTKKQDDCIKVVLRP
jgi:threonine dehydrogenase-like Zn-dependent dehydrogenase